ncbi:MULTISPECIES: response regulator [Asticcacaulis]|uniref:response regulator n=1 Tax=Asticcacaulis TaxID=76890 RepID=UPI001AE6C2BA|nr:MULTISPECIES: response regulator [Asticcacaulis]MBP2160411.1 CheY-like chemotaxis protein [Asticcacaulis solisilvae]MDR6801286.1 CheY-like chemotaxis protein [Asticcacaulis sp. BE141]
MSGPHHILLVEDNTGDAILFKRALKRANEDIAVTVAPSAEAALRILDEGPGPAAFSLAVCDINLPGISGIELLRRIRSDDGTRSLPVLMLSSSRNEDEIARCYDAFASGYIAKPLSGEGYDRMASCFTSCWLEMMELPDADAVARNRSVGVPLS